MPDCALPTSTDLSRLLPRSVAGRSPVASQEVLTDEQRELERVYLALRTDAGLRFTDLYRPLPTATEIGSRPVARRLAGGPHRRATGTGAGISRVAHRCRIALYRPLPTSPDCYRPLGRAGLGGDRRRAVAVPPRGLAPARRPGARLDRLWHNELNC